MVDKFQVFNLISSQGDVNCDYYVISIGYLTSVSPCGRCDALSSIQTYDLVTPVAIEALPSISNGNLDSIGVVELPKPVWHCSTALFLICFAQKCIITLPNFS